MNKVILQKTKIKMNIYQKLEAFVIKTFKTTLEIFLEALQMSPNAQGYVSGSISELILKNNFRTPAPIFNNQLVMKFVSQKTMSHY
jgi:hypothetical protein